MSREEMIQFALESDDTVDNTMWKIYQQGRQDAKKEINEIMDMDLPISNILYEIDKWLKEQNNG